MFCVNCGKQIPDDSAVCEYCGAAAAITIQQEAEKQPAGGPQGYENQPGYNSQPNYGEQPYYGGQPGYSAPPNYGNQPGYNAPPNYGNQPGYNVQPNYGNQPGYNVQPNYGNQPGYNAPPNYGNQPGYNAPPNYGNQQGNYANNLFKPDNKFNIWAFLFSTLWAMVHGLWDVAAASFIINVLFLLLFLTGVGSILSLVVLFIQAFLFGKNANYYYRLKEQQNISTFRALKDPNLRRI